MAAEAVRYTHRRVPSVHKTLSLSFVIIYIYYYQHNIYYYYHTVNSWDKDFEHAYRVKHTATVHNIIYYYLSAYEISE